jgi:proteic killer suppression protein
MIGTFKNKGLQELFQTGKSRKVDAKKRRKMLLILDALDQAKKPTDMNLPGFNFHGLQGFNPERYTVHVNGPWCITFEFDGENAMGVDLENYH